MLSDVTRIHNAVEQELQRLDIPKLTVPQGNEGADRRHHGTKLSALDRLAITLSLSGIRPVTAGRTDAESLGNTVVVGLHDEYGESVTQTTSASSILHDTTPFELVMGPDIPWSTLRVRTTGQEVPVRVDSNRGSTAQFYYSTRDVRGNNLPYHTNIDPRRTCTEVCSGCFRAAQYTSGEARHSRSYLDSHMHTVLSDFMMRGFHVEALQAVNIVTGCMPTSEKERQMFLDIMEFYHRSGFVNAVFGVMSYQISDIESMRQLHEAGLRTFTRTVEVFDDEKRRQVWGKKKGETSLEKHKQVLATAKDVFPVVEIALVLGYDSRQETLDRARELAEMGVTIFPQVPRLYNQESLNLVHPDFVQDPMGFLIDSFEAVLANHREMQASGRGLPWSVYNDQRAAEYQRVHGTDGHADIWKTPRKYRQ